MSYLQQAFDAICNQSIQAGGCYVVLMEEVLFYGGPEEGGWWGRNTYIVAYQHFPTRFQAEVAEREIRLLAEELQAESRKTFGEQCLREMAWLDARGLDADFLPEPDGESRYYVKVCEELPTESRGCRHYE